MKAPKAPKSRIVAYKDATEAFKKDHARLRKAGAWGSATRVRYRHLAQVYLVSTGHDFKRVDKEYVSGMTSKKRAGFGIEFTCGCFIPVGYPLYRRIAPCDKHKRAFVDPKELRRAWPLLP